MQAILKKPSVSGVICDGLEGNTTLFLKPLVIDNRYDRERYAQACVMDGDDGDVNEETRNELRSLRWPPRPFFEIPIST